MNFRFTTYLALYTPVCQHPQSKQRLFLPIHIDMHIEAENKRKT